MKTLFTFVVMLMLGWCVTNLLADLQDKQVQRLNYCSGFFVRTHDGVWYSRCADEVAR